MYRAIYIYIYMNDIHIQMQLVYIVILSATGYCYSIIDSISLQCSFLWPAFVKYAPVIQ